MYPKKDCKKFIKIVRESKPGCLGIIRCDLNPNTYFPATFCDKCPKYSQHPPPTAKIMGQHPTVTWIRDGKIDTQK